MAFLKTKLGTPRPVRRYSLVKLPVELILLIGRQVRRNQYLKNLRLVCKLFDDIFAPVVLSHIRLGGDWVSLRDLTRRNESLAFVKSWAVQSLDWLVFRPEGFHERSRATLHYLLLAPIRYLSSAKDTPPLSKELTTVQYYLKKLQKRCPNLESVRWHVDIEKPKTSRALLFKVLVSMPSLKELDLFCHEYNDRENLASFMYPLAQVTGLQKLTVRFHGSYFYCLDGYLRWFCRLIADNPNLAYLHLTWDYGRRALFREPVYLLAPYLRSLQSLNIRWGNVSDFWEPLALNGIFIPFVTVDYVCKSLCEYLSLNASLVSFAMIDSWYSFGSSPFDVMLFRALETTNVAQITISPFNWAKWYKNTKIEVCLRRCAKLRRITLIFHSLPVYKDIRATAETVSRLGDKISLEISGDDDIHRAFRKCCQSEEPLMKSLQHRLVFLELIRAD